MTRLLLATPLKSPAQIYGQDLANTNGLPGSSDSQFIEPTSNSKNLDLPRQRDRTVLSIGDLFSDLAAPDPVYGKKWEKTRKGGNNRHCYDFKQCQVTLHGCQSCLFSYCVLYEPAAYTNTHFLHDEFWFNADFVNTFFQLCHHDTHATHDNRIMYLPIPSDQLRHPKAPLVIPSVFDFNGTTTTLIHPILHGRHYVVIVVHIPSCLIEVIDGFWNMAHCKKIKRQQFHLDVNDFMTKLHIWPTDATLDWKLSSSKKSYTVSLESSMWTVQYKPVLSQLDTSSCGPRACSAAATIYYPTDPRSTSDFTGWSRNDVVKHYEDRLLAFKNDQCFGLSL